MRDPEFPRPRLREEFRRELRARLMQEAPVALAPRRGSAWTFLRPAFAVGLAGLVLVAGAGTAAAGSLPGDPAFVLKRAFEDAQVTLTFDDVKRVELLAQIADRRLAELQVVADRKDETKAPTASEEFAQAVTRFRAAVDAVQQAAPEDKADKVQDLVDAARDKHEAVLDEVQQKIDNEKAQEAIERAKDEENKDTKSDKKDPKKTPRPTRTPSRSPRSDSDPSDSPRVSITARATIRTETLRPSPTPRPSGRD
ncbi:MAG TPA: DUF5667 domain-containing protein [Candidatus Limnocylindria bacterium]|nr:DUF5667 domain-containing protein [Candidatus Limnocylindria bacterium]